MFISIKDHPPGETPRIADQHENYAAGNNRFSGGVETANPKAEKALLTNSADARFGLIADSTAASE